MKPPTLAQLGWPGAAVLVFAMLFSAAIFKPEALGPLERVVVAIMSPIAGILSAVASAGAKVLPW